MLRILIILLFVGCPSAMRSTAPQTDSLPRKKVAVVLSGGGAKGMAHIGALKVIERAGIPIDIITGTSMGSIVGGLYSIGHDAQELDSLVHAQDWPFLLSDKREIRSPYIDGRQKQNTYFLSKAIGMENGRIIANRSGMVQGRNLAALFAELTAAYADSMDFAQLPIPFACVATDIIDNSEYDFTSGRLAEAMRTSMSIPGVFAPIRKGERLLVDGGLRNNFPVDLAQQLGAEVVIGVTVQAAPKTADDLKTTMAVLSQIVDVNCKNKYDDNLSRTDIAIRVDTRGYSSASFTPAAIDTLMARGEQEAMKHWDELIALREQLGLPPLTEGGAAGWAGQRAFKTVPAAEGQGTSGPSASRRNDMTLLQGGLGVRFDTEEYAAVQLNGNLQPRRLPLTLEGTLRLGKRMLSRVDLAVTHKERNLMRLSYQFRHNDLNVYYEGDRDFNLLYNQHTVELSVVNLNIRNFKIDAGGRWDVFDFHDVLVAPSDNFGSDGIANTHYYKYYARVDYNSENTWNFATRGARFHADYSYVTDNLTGYRHHAGLSDLSAAWRMAFPITRRLTFQPMVYGRMVFGDDMPYCLSNFVGGSWFGHYADQQMPFAGIGHVEPIEKKVVAAQIKLQERLTDNNYILLEMAGACHSNDLGDLLKHSPLLGVQAAYYYNSFFGPLGGTVGYSGRTKQPYFYINLGFQF